MRSLILIPLLLQGHSGIATSPFNSAGVKHSNEVKLGLHTFPNAEMGQITAVSNSPQLGCLSGWNAAWPSQGWVAQVVKKGLSWPWISRPVCK